MYTLYIYIQIYIFFLTQKGSSLDGVVGGGRAFPYVQYFLYFFQKNYCKPKSDVIIQMVNTSEGDMPCWKRSY